MDKNYQVLLEKLAITLAGRPVTIRWQAPAIRQFDAAAARQGSRGVIDIRPDMTPDQSLSALIHEAMHIRHSFDRLGPPDTFSPGSLRLTDSGSRRYHADPMEDVAKHETLQALAYADREYKFYGDDSTPLAMRKAMALLNLYSLPDGIGAAIDQAVVKAIRQRQS